MTTTPATSLEAFITAKAKIDAMLVHLTALSADNFETSPDKITWGDVGDLNRIAALLERTTEAAA